MVYCPECGAQNEEEAQYCLKCGAALKGGAAPVYRRDEKEEKEQKNEKDEKDEPGPSGRSWALFVGLFIILVGAISLAEDYLSYSWGDLWPYLVIFMGLFFIIIAGTVLQFCM